MIRVFPLDHIRTEGLYDRLAGRAGHGFGWYVHRDPSWIETSRWYNEPRPNGVRGFAHVVPTGLSGAGWGGGDCYGEDLARQGIRDADSVSVAVRLRAAELCAADDDELLEPGLPEGCEVLE
jgi:hypothetical protein